MSLREMVAARMSREQKDAALRVRAFAAYWLKLPYRAWRAAGMERRMPPIRGRSWRTKLPRDLQITMMHGTTRYAYRGIPMLKNPLDVAIYQRLLWDLKPRSVIEIGSKYGGSAVWLADVLALYERPAIVWSIDITPPNPRPYYCPTNVRFVAGDEADLSPLQDIFQSTPHPWLVINDASHMALPCLASMEYLDGFIEKGDYLVVEDGFISEVGVDARFGGGPAMAIAQFLNGKGRGKYEVDPRYCDHFGVNVTANPNGYLKRL